MATLWKSVRRAPPWGSRSRSSGKHEPVLQPLMPIDLDASPA